MGWLVCLLAFLGTIPFNQVTGAFIACRYLLTAIPTHQELYAMNLLFRYAQYNSGDANLHFPVISEPKV